MVPDEGVVVLTPFEGCEASLFGRCMPVLLCQSEYAQTGSIGLFGVIFGAEHRLEECQGMGAHALSAANKIFLAPFADKAVGGGHVVFLSGISIGFVAVSMQGNSLVLVKYLDVLGVVQNLDFAAHMPIWNTVVVFCAT